MTYIPFQPTTIIDDMSSNWDGYHHFDPNDDDKM
jgi:hypothetical protein